MLLIRLIIPFLTCRSIIHSRRQTVYIPEKKTQIEPDCLHDRNIHLMNTICSEKLRFEEYTKKENL